MQVGHARVHLRFDHRADVRGKSWIVLRVQQHQSAVADEAIGPRRDHGRADQTDQGIEQLEPEQQARRQRENREDGCRRIGQHMDIGGTQIVVVMMSGVIVVVMIVWLMQEHAR